MSSQSFRSARAMADHAVKCASCSRVNLVWMWLRRGERSWDGVCIDCVGVMLSWAMLAGTEVVAELEDE